MKLNHINLPTTDVPASRDFFAKYFGMETTQELGRGTMAMMRDEVGMVLNLSRFDKTSEVHYHKDFHVGFFVDTRAEVDDVYAKMVADGLEVDAPKRMPGRFAFYVQAPGGFVVEVAKLEESD
jgi:lactoylglutathione lyase